MRKISAAVVALVMAGALSGCGSLPVGRTPSPTPTVDQAAIAEARVAREPAFLAALREQLTTVDASPQLWVDLGHAVCEAFDQGLTPKQVFDSMSGGGIAKHEASAVVVNAGIHLCPEYAPAP